MRVAEPAPWARGNATSLPKELSGGQEVFFVLFCVEVDNFLPASLSLKNQLSFFVV